MTDRIAEFNALLEHYYDTHDGQVLRQLLYSVAVVDFESRNVPVNSTEQPALQCIVNNSATTYDELALAIGKTHNRRQGDFLAQRTGVEHAPG